VEAAGPIDVTPHNLRATHATWVPDMHGVMAAARRPGNSNASVTTRQYGLVAGGEAIHHQYRHEPRHAPGSAEGALGSMVRRDVIARFRGQ
jgi:integrase